MRLTRSGPRTWAIVLALCAVPWLASAEALDLRREVVQGRYLIHNWDLSDGLPQASITDMAQGSDGFLWLTTFGGLVRFDGRDFRSVGGASTTAGWNPRMTAVEASLGRTLWVGLQSGGVARFEPGGFVDVEQPDELRNATVWDLSLGSQGLLVAADGEGDLWAVGVRSVHRLGRAAEVARARCSSAGSTRPRCWPSWIRTRCPWAWCRSGGPAHPSPRSATPRRSAPRGCRSPPARSG